MKDKVLIDTSIWIAYFQKDPDPSISDRVDDFLGRSEVFVPKIVLAELIQGAHSEKELEVIREFLQAFHVIAEREDTWLQAGELSFRLRKRGKTANLADCYIATIARENDAAVFTLDTHFKDIEKEIHIALIPI